MDEELEIFGSPKPAPRILVVLASLIGGVWLSAFVISYFYQRKEEFLRSFIVAMKGLGLFILLMIIAVLIDTIFAVPMVIALPLWVAANVALALRMAKDEDGWLAGRKEKKKEAALVGKKKEN